MSKLPASYHRVGVAAATTFFMTFLVSGLATYRALQPGQPMFETWMSSWIFSWAVACPTMYVVMPRVRRLVGRVIHEP